MTEMQRDDIEPRPFYTCVLYVVAIMCLMSVAISAVNSHYDDYLCTNPYYKEAR